jgi:sporulation protein YlmC with PRC-barrel domain
METYVILRRGGWRSSEELQEAALRSTAAVEQMSEHVRWIRSYTLEEPDGSIGTVCIYQATSPEAIRAHASAARLPIDEIITVGDTLIVRPDPRAAQRSVVPTQNMGSPADEDLTPAS